MITNTLIGYNGRLGNQMYQFGILYILRWLFGYEIKIPLKNAIEYNDIFEKLELFSVFNLNQSYLSATIDTSGFNFINKRGVVHYDDVFDVSDNTDVRGDFQSAYYYTPYRDILRDLYQFYPFITKKCEGYLKNIKTKKELVGIHVRRTDYITLNSALDKEYYLNLLTKFDPDKFDFVCVSDDIRWCKENLPSYIKFSNNHSSVDLCILTLCDHIIMANSTFSWWGAFLNKMGGNVYMPKVWFSETYKEYYNLKADESVLVWDGVTVV